MNPIEKNSKNKKNWEKEGKINVLFSDAGRDFEEEDRIPFESSGIS